MAETDLHFSEQPFEVPGATLHVRRWRSSHSRACARLLVLHGYMEHGARYAELAHALAGRGIETTTLDLRGHGRSSGQRGYVRLFDDYVDDATRLLDTLGSDVPRFVLGHSNGALIALLLTASCGKSLRGTIVTNPFLAQTRPVRGPKKWIGDVAASLWPRLSLPSGLRAADLTHDQALLAAHLCDPLIFNTVNASWFAQVKLAQARVKALQELSVPLLYIYSDADPVASPAANARLARTIVAPEKQVIERPLELHEVLNEVRRQETFTHVADFIVSQGT